MSEDRKYFWLFKDIRKIDEGAPFKNFVIRLPEPFHLLFPCAN